MRMTMNTALKAKLAYILEVIQNQPSHSVVQIFAFPAYYLLIVMLFNQVIDFIPDGWDYSNKVYVPRVSISSPRYKSSYTDNSLTLVTAYFNLGTLQKGSALAKHYQSPKSYRKWMQAFSKLNNSVLAFTDSEDVRSAMLSLRKSLPAKMTTVVLLKRDTLWSFQLAPKIKKVYQQPGYPVHHPNTVNELYSCAMHSKYDLLEMVIKKKMFDTKYLAWIDLGYFRDEVTEYFKLEVPPDLKTDHITFLQIYKFYSGMTPQQIVDLNAVWIAGGMFVGVPEYLMTFIDDYKRSVESMIEDNVMSTDQQVLYSMYSKESNLQPRVPIQTYYHKCRCDWFYIGNLCSYISEMKKWPHLSINYFFYLYL